MATYQYRLNGTFDWQSASGNAIVALVNKPSSGKKISVRSVEIAPFEYIDAVGPPGASARVRWAVARLSSEVAESLDGVDVPIVAADTADTWPAAVRVMTDAPTVYGASPEYFRYVQTLKKLSTANTPAAAMLAHGVSPFERDLRDTDTQPIVVRAGESVVVMGDAVGRNLPLRVEATLVRAGSPDETYRVSFATYARYLKSAFAIMNPAGSGETISIYDISIFDVGGFDSPYFQFVPVGSVVEPAAAQAIVALPLDTADPDPATWVGAYANVPIMPYGLPENALSDASVGSPKGSNYLKSKDFIGPVWRVFFAEVGCAAGLRADGVTLASIDSHDLGLVGADSAIVLREGEGAALVSASELATSGLSILPAGRAAYEISITFDVEPKLIPTLTLTGLKNPTEVRVFSASTTTEVGGQESITGGTFAMTYDSDALTHVDIAILSLGYQNLRLANVALGGVDVSIPIQQQVDRQYANP